MAEYDTPPAPLAPRIQAAYRGQPDSSPLTTAEGAAVLTGLRAHMAAGENEREMEIRAEFFLRHLRSAVPHAATQMSALAQLPFDAPRPEDDGVYATYLLAWSKADDDERRRLIAERDLSHEERSNKPLDDQSTVAFGAASQWLNREIETTPLVDPVAQATRVEDRAVQTFRQQRIQVAEAPVWAQVAKGEISSKEAVAEAYERRRAIRKAGRHPPTPPRPPQGGQAPKGFTT